MAVIGGFIRSDLSITRKTGGNLETFPRVFCFPKSRVNENGGTSLSKGLLSFFRLLVFKITAN